ncbi:Multifunctional conjugation protein TraI [Phycisphaerae bacterium RAS2]|nr:Multifunctional conjugation protein TraI [Phycisphaerae bacterium RAS2]
MLRIIQQTSAAGAKSYYSTADYYSEGQELEGRWRGEGAKRLGLSGTVEKKDWDALCDNRDPVTGNVLTARQKAHRRIGYDFNFHVPKSISIVYGLTKDERILDAFRESVNATMQDMEAEMKTRVRAAGNNEDRTTGNMVWGEFIHTTARPVDGLPDPHLHAHAFVFNTTWDEKEQRWKAGQFADLKRDAPYFEAVFYSRFARRLEELGLPIERKKKGWELRDIPKSVIEKFSRRTALIEKEAKERGLTSAAEKDQLGAKTREKKQKEIAFDELREVWRSRLTAEESNAVTTVAKRIGGSAIGEDLLVAAQAASRAVEHCLERSSVVPERKLLTEALRRSVGAASSATITRKVNTMNLITGERDGRRLVTTREVLAEEQRMIDFAREGRGTCPALGDALYAIKRDWLNDGQRRAVKHLLTSHDRVMLIRGAAGTGKTAMAQEAVEAIEADGKRVFMFAPSADASRGVLRQDGFENADTIARLLIDEHLQAQIHGQVIWVDEAGLLGTRQMGQVFDLAERLKARVILSGDRKQHGSVERGAALRLLEQEAGLVPAEIQEIQRQRGEYKQAVKALSEGRTEAGFRQLDKLGWVREVNKTDRYAVMAQDYVAALAEGKSALVVSPTHREGEWISDEIRACLKRIGKIGDGERRLIVLENANLTEAERADGVNYAPDSVLVFHQNAKGFKKGERVTVGSTPPPLSEAAKFQVFNLNILPVAPGDVVRVTRNGKTADGKHGLNNGDLFKVLRFDAGENLVVRKVGANKSNASRDNWIIQKDYGHLAHGYCVTSHASQGKTVDRVFIGQSSESFPASSREQFYVSVSRGREGATIYTDDKAALLDAVSRSDERLTATELVAQRQRQQRALVLQRLNRQFAEPPMPAHAGNRHHERGTYDRH